MNNIEFFGENEDKNSDSFIKRYSHKHNYTEECPTKNYQWAEIKTSLLVQELYNNTEIHKTLVTFLQNIIIRIFSRLNIDYNTELLKYMQEIKKNINNEFYPVGQLNAFIDDKEGFWDDFYGISNFIRYVFVELQNSKYDGYHRNQSIQTKNYIKLVAELMSIFTSFTYECSSSFNSERGFYEDQVTDNHVGITNVRLKELEKNIHNKSDYKTKPWIHPGNQRCKVPYYGKYGTYIKEYIENNDFYGSTQCGISGSGQITFYMYLFSICKEEIVVDEIYNNDIRNIITSVVLLLIGDGGHNVREIIFGLTSTVTILYNIIRVLEIELQKHNENKKNIIENSRVPDEKNMASNLLLNIFNYPNKVISSTFTSNLLLTIFNYTKKDISSTFAIFKAMGFIDKFITLFYKETSDINIVGVYKHDLFAVGVDDEDIKDTNGDFLNLRKSLIDFLILSIRNDESQLIDLKYEHIRNLQLFLAFDNNRFLLDPDISFKRIANKKIKEAINKFGPQGKTVLDNVNKTLDQLLDKCNPPARSTRSKRFKLEKNYDSDTYPPFAFMKKPARKSSTKKLSTRKSARKSSTKKLSTRKSVRKSSTKKLSKKKPVRKYSGKKLSKKKPVRKYSGKKLSKKKPVRKSSSKKLSTRKSVRKSSKKLSKKKPVRKSSSKKL